MVGKLHDNAMILRVFVGTATDDEGVEYEMSTSTAGAPLIYCRATKRFFSLSWEDILTLAIKAGISR